MDDADLAQPALRTARDAARLLAGYFAGASREKLVVAHLDERRRLVGITEIEGCRVEVSLPIRLIVREALAADAAGFVLAHNHPSGRAEPSAADRDASRTLAQAAAPLGLIVHDHLIFTGTDCQSMRALGLL